MENWQVITVTFFAFYSLIGFFKAVKETVKSKNPYGLTKFFGLTGSYVWGDLVIFGFFWTIVSLVTLILKDWIFFLLTLSVFWAVRGLGETIYWLNEQFVTEKRNPIERFWIKKYFPQDFAHVVQQIVSQCITVIATICAIYFAKIWF